MTGSVSSLELRGRPVRAGVGSHGDDDRPQLNICMSIRWQQERRRTNLVCFAPIVRLELQLLLLLLIGLSADCGPLRSVTSRRAGRAIATVQLLQQDVQEGVHIRPRKLGLVATPSPVLSYHDGPLLTRPLRVHLLWYGSFSAGQRAIVTDFVLSLRMKSRPKSSETPAVSRWWRTTRTYKDASKSGVAASVRLGKLWQDASYSMGKNLTKADVATLLGRALATERLPMAAAGGAAIYVVLTADDVLVEDFCMNTCGFHSSSPAAITSTPAGVSNSAVSHDDVAFLWVGNPGKQCPGLCAWPYAVPEFGPPNPPLVVPNGDVGMEGLIINLAALLAGTATNPFRTGYYEGDSSDPSEAVTACSGIFARGHYPGYPGNLRVDEASGASYNALGLNGRRFLLPAMWSPATRSCFTLL